MSDDRPIYLTLPRSEVEEICASLAVLIRGVPANDVGASRLAAIRGKLSRELEIAATCEHAAVILEEASREYPFLYRLRCQICDEFVALPDSEVLVRRP